MLNIDEIKNNFELLDDAEDKYAYIIELGKSLPLMPEYLKTESNKISGCTSQVWLAYEIADDKIISYIADSDAFIVKGLIAILLAFYSGKTPAQILNLDAEKLFADLDLKHHLSPSRRNGFASMIVRIKEIAKKNQNI